MLFGAYSCKHVEPEIAQKPTGRLGLSVAIATLVEQVFSYATIMSHLKSKS